MALKKGATVYRIQDAYCFKESNLRNWRLNSDFWLLGTMRHLQDVHDSTSCILAEVLVGHQGIGRPRLLDVGCGEGWLLRLIREKGFNVDYVGMDFNERFISALARQEVGSDDASFVLHDIEEEFPKALIGSVDVVMNLFNFFEVPRLALGFRNTAAALRRGGSLVILTIDPVIQLVAISNSLQELKDALREYEDRPEGLGYDKRIDAADSESGRIYKGVLYSIATYIELAKQNGLRLIDYREVVRTANRVPQIYQYVIFRK